MEPQRTSSHVSPSDGTHVLPWMQAPLGPGFEQVPLPEQSASERHEHEPFTVLSSPRSALQVEPDAHSPPPLVQRLLDTAMTCAHE